MRHPIAFIISLGLVGQAYAQEPPLRLVLSCPGSATGMAAVENTTARVQGSYGGSASANATRSEMTTITGTVTFKLTDGVAEINVPAQFLPPMRGGKAGWFPVKELLVSDDQIIGKVTLNFLNSSRFRIDRRSGQISTSGGFSGQCNSVTDQPRKF